MIRDTEANECFIFYSEVDKFLLQDKKSEREYKYSLQRSVLAAREAEVGLLSGYSIYVTKQTKPPPNEIKGMYRFYFPLKLC